MKLSNKSADVLVDVSTLTWLWGHRYLLLYIVGIFLFFNFFFIHALKKHKNVNKQTKIKKATFYALKKRLRKKVIY